MRGQVIQVFEVEVVARLFIQRVQILYKKYNVYIYYSVDFVSGSVVRKKHQPIVV